MRRVRGVGESMLIRTLTSVSSSHPPVGPLIPRSYFVSLMKEAIVEVSPCFDYSVALKITLEITDPCIGCKSTLGYSVKSRILSYPVMRSLRSIRDDGKD